MRYSEGERKSWSWNRKYSRQRKTKMRLIQDKWGRWWKWRVAPHVHKWCPTGNNYWILYINPPVAGPMIIPWQSVPGASSQRTVPYALSMGNKQSIHWRNYHLWMSDESLAMGFTQIVIFKISLQKKYYFKVRQKCVNHHHIRIWCNGHIRDMSGIFWFPC